jgi:hypothetical protein
VIQSAIAACITMCSSGAANLLRSSDSVQMKEFVCAAQKLHVCISSASELDESYYVRDFLNTPWHKNYWAVGAAGLRCKCSETALAQDVINRGEKIVPGCARCQIFK